MSSNIFKYIKKVAFKLFNNSTNLSYLNFYLLRTTYLQFFTTYSLGQLSIINYIFKIKVKVCIYKLLIKKPIYQNKFKKIFTIAQLYYYLTSIIILNFFCDIS